MSSPEIYENALAALNSGDLNEAFRLLADALNADAYKGGREFIYKAVAQLFYRDISAWTQGAFQSRESSDGILVYHVRTAIPYMITALFNQQESGQQSIFAPPWMRAANDLEALNEDLQKMAFAEPPPPPIPLPRPIAPISQPDDEIDLSDARGGGAVDFDDDTPRGGEQAHAESGIDFDESDAEDIPRGGIPATPKPQKKRDEPPQFEAPEPAEDIEEQVKTGIYGKVSESEESEAKPPPPPIPFPPKPIAPNDDTDRFATQERKREQSSVPDDGMTKPTGTGTNSPVTPPPTARPSKPITPGAPPQNAPRPASKPLDDPFGSTGDFTPLTPEPVQFSSFYSKDVKPKTWYPVKAYLFRESAQDAIESDANKQFGGVLTNIRTVLRAARTVIQQGAEVTATPSIPGFQFDPIRVTVQFTEQWHRFDFKIRATTADADDSHKGMITFTVEGLIVAEVPLSVYVSDSAPDPAEATLEAGAQVTHKPYAAVFCSYSRKDEPVVKRVEKAIKTLGFDYWRDLTTLRPGEDWDDRLLDLIDKADIFQLFWSSNSASSAAVRKEWSHALKVGSKRANFIRPVFWEQPIPTPPSELGHINFVYDPELNQ